VLRHATVQGILASMPKRRMPQVVGQRYGLYQVLVDAQRARNGSPQLGDLQRVGQSRTEQVALVVEKNLRLVDQPPKRRGVHDPVPITLVFGSRWCRCFWVAPPLGRGRVAGVRRQIKGQIQICRQRLYIKRN